VVADTLIEDGVWIWGTTYDAVVGASNGIMMLSPTYVTANSGLTLWYNGESFTKDDKGKLGALSDFETQATFDSNIGFPSLSPIPGPTERPFLTFGNRTYLTPIPCANDASLPSPSAVVAGTFAWSQTTGKIVLSTNDIKKAIPGDALYNIEYLKADIFYLGVALNAIPLPVKSPVVTQNASGENLIGIAAGGAGVVTGDFFIPKAVSFPTPISGVRYLPDGTGEVPVIGTPTTRPNGCGLVRRIEGVGDTFPFTVALEPEDEKAFATLEVHEYEVDLPGLSFLVRNNKSEICQEEADPAPSAGLSKGVVKPRKIVGHGLYFMQAEALPSHYCTTPKIYSRHQQPFTLSGGDVLRFRVGTTDYTWTTTLGAGTHYTADQIVSSLETNTTPPLPAGAVGSFRGRVWLADTNPTGSVIIGWNADPGDLSGHSALGLLPGWKVDIGNGWNWLSDNGVSIGLYRSPVNLNGRDLDAPDIRAFSTFEDKILTDSIPGTPTYLINNHPLENVAGFNTLPGTQNVHFRMKLGLLEVDLPNYGSTNGIGIKYVWENNQFMWTKEAKTSPTQVLTPANILQLDHQSVLVETLSSAAMEPTGTGYGLYLKEAPSRSNPVPMATQLTEGTDFLMAAGGAPGQASLINVYGGVIFEGGDGSQTGTTFTDANVNQTTFANSVAADDKLHVKSGDNEGLYTITDVDSSGSAVSLTVAPAFRNTVSGGCTWAVYDGISKDAYDPSIVADVLMVETNHLPEEPFKIRVLSKLGVLGTDTLIADVADALESDRATFLRLGMSLNETGTNQIPVQYLTTGSALGSLSPTGLFVDPSDPHVSASGSASSYFQIRIGADAYSTAEGNLSLNAASVAAGFVDVNTTSGAITVAEDVVTDLGGSSVYFDQTLFPPTVQPASYVGCNPTTGELAVAQSVIVAFPSADAYFMERMVAGSSKDVQISPMAGSMFFMKPLREGQVVEAAYYQADGYGDKKVDEEGNTTEIVEFLTLPVRLEVATRVDPDNAKVFAFNPDGKTVATTDKFEPLIWAGSDLQNYAGEENCAFDPAASTLTFNTDVVAEGAPPVDPYDPWRHEPVKITYGVYEAFGGEHAYSVSTLPVYRKPFFINEEKSSFVLEGDRQSDFPANSLMLIGPTPFYITSTSYDSATGTTVNFFPPTQREAGSRSPGNDVPLLISDLPVAWPDPSAADRGSFGFLMEVDIPYEVADKGQLKIIFQGDATQFTRPNHILEIGGYPYLVANSNLTTDGRYTIVNLANPLYTKHTYGTDVTKFSARAVYKPDPVEFTGILPLEGTEEYALFLTGERDGTGELPGRVLKEGIEYEINPTSGAVLFKYPNQGGLAPHETLWLRYTSLRTISPALVEGAVIAPVFLAKNLSMTFPTVENRILGSFLKAQYTFRNPDSYFYETLTLKDYLPQVSEATKGQVTTPGSGPPVTSPGETDIAKQGNFGLRSEVQNLRDQDRAARAYIQYFNEIVLAFEQVLETIDGRIIGDRDGKFKFFIGRDKVYPPPGYEDPVSGDLNKRLIWREVVDSWAPSSFEAADGYLTERDSIFNPLTATVPDPTDKPGDPSGEPMDPDLLSFFLARQRYRVRNDMDDRVLIGLRRPKGWPSIFPLFTSRGRFKDMWQDHSYSRLFPEATTHFSQLYPGLEASYNSDGAVTSGGYYSAGRLQTVPGPNPGETQEKVIKTRGSEIGVVANPALGEITGVVSVEASDRRARARIWAYYPQGSADLDDALSISTVGKATIVATPVAFSEFYLGDDGFPDLSKLVSGGGEQADLVSGDFNLSTPGFKVGQRLAFGKPPGVLGSNYILQDISGGPILVGDMPAACVITLANYDGDVSGLNVLVNGTVPLESIVSNETGYGDTIYSVAPLNEVLENLSDSESPTLEEIAAGGLGLPDYNMQFDLRAKKRKGVFTDNSLPSAADDSFPLKELFGQNPPTPLSCIEGPVGFVNTDQEPVQLPCLLGQDKNDSGDYSIPYLASSECELSILGAIEPYFRTLLGDTSYSPLPSTTGYPTGAPTGLKQMWDSIYPNEIRVSDGEIYLTNQVDPGTSPWRNPATLYTKSSNLQPVKGVAPWLYGTDSGVGSLRPYDLVLVEADPASNTDLFMGMKGILSVGDVYADTFGDFNWSSLEPPRFASQSAPGIAGTMPATTSAEHGNLAYTLRGYAGCNTGDADGTGIIITDVASGIPGVDFQSVINVSDFPGLSFNEVAQLVRVWGITPQDKIAALQVNIFDPDPAAVGDPYKGSILIPQINDASTGTPASLGLASTVYVKPVVGAVAALNISATGGGVAPAPGLLQMDLNFSALYPGQDICSILGLVNGQRYDFTLDLDTYIDDDTFAASGSALPAISLGAGTGSETAFIRDDRLTFCEHLTVSRTDVSYSLPRGAQPANGVVSAFFAPGSMEAQLSVHLTKTSGSPFSGVNSPKSVNRDATQPYPDGAEPFTFLTRLGGSTATGNMSPGVEYVSYNVPSGADNVAYFRAMAWEGGANAPLTVEASNIILSGVPSSHFNKTDIISKGSGDCHDNQLDAALTGTLTGPRTWIQNVTNEQGDTATILSGDSLVIQGTNSAGAGAAFTDGGIKAGTYLVRHSVANSAVTDADGQPVLRSNASTIGGNDGALDLTFPTILSADQSTNTIVIQGSPHVPNREHGWNLSASNRAVHLILDSTYATWTGPLANDYDVNPVSVVKLDITSLVYDGDGQLTFTMAGTPGGTDAYDANGDAFSTDAWWAAAQVGVKVSGMRYLPIHNLGSATASGDSLPDNNCVGAISTSVGDPLYGGFAAVACGNVNPAIHSGAPGYSDNTVTWGAQWLNIGPSTPPNTVGVLAQEIDTGAGANGGDLVVDMDYTVPNPWLFQDDVRRPVYAKWYDLGLDGANTEYGRVQGVAQSLDLWVSMAGVGEVKWERLRWGNGPPASVTTPNSALMCVLPGDVWTFGNRVTTPGHPTEPTIPGFHALSGVFLEPSFPLPTADLNRLIPQVVSASHSGAQVGMRQVIDWDEDPATAGTVFMETVSFFVRRMRRFQPVQMDIAALMKPLKYVYSMRTGTVGSYASASRTFTSAVLGTTVGPFNDASVNINPGDTLRVYAADGSLLDSAEIQQVSGASTLILSRPGLTTTTSLAGLKFEVWLNQAMVPHEQSCEQLLDLVTDKTLYRRTVDYTGSPTDPGGTVPAYNTIQDPDVTSWSVLPNGSQVLEGDYVVIDPAGVLYDVEEQGSRPTGDRSVEARTDVLPDGTDVYREGGPEPLDDNRGFYKVTAIDTNTLTVDGTSRFTDGTEDGASPVTFGGPGAEYAVLPTVHDSQIDGSGTGPDPEGQQALRPTALPVGNLYLDRTPENMFKSIEPFGFRVIRPNTVFSTDALELVLFMRERMLSWMEEVEFVYTDTTGSYFIFQEKDQIDDIGFPNSITTGVGIWTNAMVESIRGITTLAPFANVNDCVSVLDRRFWILDFNLDSQTPSTSATPYATFAENTDNQRPVLPDLIDEVLDLQDKFREQRFSWIAFRADRTDGSIQAAKRAESKLPRKLRKQRRLLLQQEALNKS